MFRVCSSCTALLTAVMLPLIAVLTAVMLPLLIAVMLPLETLPDS